MIASLIRLIGLPVFVTSLSKVLKSIEKPVAEKAGSVLEEVEVLIKKGEVSEAEQVEAHRHFETVLAAELAANKKTIEEINESLRAEIANQDMYVRRMRPTFGYIMAFTWFAQMSAVAYVIVFDTNRAHLALEAIESLGTIWAVALSVLGVYVYKRSEDKKLFYP